MKKKVLAAMLTLCMTGVLTPPALVNAEESAEAALEITDGEGTAQAESEPAGETSEETGITDGETTEESTEEVSDGGNGENSSESAEGVPVSIDGEIPQVTDAAEETSDAAEEKTAAESEEEVIRPRAIITTDLEVDDMNSLIHLCLFFNDVEIEGVVYSASTFHFTGDGEHTLTEVNPDPLCEGMINGEQVTPPEELTEWRPMELGWIENLWSNEYAEAYEYLVQNDSRYPSPEELLAVTKVGNVEFEGDVREATEGSDLIKDAMLDDDPRTLYVYSWGGFNTVARALLSVAEEYQDTDQWEEVYQKICDKVVFVGTSQDTTYKNYIAELYPDLKLMNYTDGYAGYFTALNGQADVIDMFNSEWLSENIEFNHGSLNSKYITMGDGTHLEGEPDVMQYGETTVIDWGDGDVKELDQYDFISEGDTAGFLPLIQVGLRGLEKGYFDTWGGRIFYNTSSITDEDRIAELTADECRDDYNYVKGTEASSKRYLKAFQEEWAARADWCVSDYDSCNHAPAVKMETVDFEAAPGETVALNAEVSDPDGNALSSYWRTDEYTSVYSGEYKGIQVWDPISASTSFTVPDDAAAGDRFIFTLTVKDQADAPMTRYAQVCVTVTEALEEEAE